MRESNPKSLLFLSLFNSVLGLSILFPILAPLGRLLRLTEIEVGWLSTAYSLMQFIASPIWGRYSEKVGRKPVLLIGILGFGLSFGAFGFIAELGFAGALSGAPLFAALLATRLLGGFLSSATMPTAQAYMADITERSTRTAGMALVGAAFGLGVVFGPAIGAGLGQFGLLVPVYTSAVIALFNALFVWQRLPEPKRHARLEAFSPSGTALSRVWPILAVGFTVALASVAMEQTVAFLYQDTLKLPAKAAAGYVGAGLVCYGVTAVIAQGFIVRRVKWSPLTLILVGCPIAFVGFLGLAVAGQFAWLSLALALLGFGQGLVVPAIAAALSLGVSEQKQGEVAGLNSAAQALGRTLGPLLGTVLYGWHARSPYQLSAGLVLVVSLVVLFTPALRRQVAGARPATVSR